jgi:hypothetical protein
MYSRMRPCRAAPPPWLTPPPARKGAEPPLEHCSFSRAQHPLRVCPLLAGRGQPSTGIFPYSSSRHQHWRVSCTQAYALEEHRGSMAGSSALWSRAPSQSPVDQLYPRMRPRGAARPRWPAPPPVRKGAGPPPGALWTFSRARPELNIVFACVPPS